MLRKNAQHKHCIFSFVLFSLIHIEMSVLTFINRYVLWVSLYHFMCLIICVTRPPLERRFNWVPDPAPTPTRDHGKENHPPTSEPRKLPRKMRSRRKKREHYQRLPGATGSAPGTSQRSDECLSEAFLASPASAESTASPLSSQ